MSVEKYRKRPIVIEAYPWLKVSEYAAGETRDVDYYRTPDLDGDMPCKHCSEIMHNHGWVDTLEGGHIVCPGDFIIKGVQGEFYPCKPDIFEKTYEKIETITDKTEQTLATVVTEAYMGACSESETIEHISTQYPGVDLSIAYAMWQAIDAYVTYSLSK